VAAPLSNRAATARDRAAGVSGVRLRLQLTPQSRIFLALAPVDFRKGIDGLAAVCRQTFAQNPLDGAIDVFRNRTGTTLKLLCYDGQGYWLGTKRLSAGRLQWWPRADGATVRLAARELQVLLGNGCPAQAAMADDWRQVA
jgi:transposase